MIKYDKFTPISPNGLMLYIETYGCQMNVNDTEVIISIMKEAGYTYTTNMKVADVILVNTCSIRDNAEQRIWGRLGEFSHVKNERKNYRCGYRRLYGGTVERGTYHPS